MNKSTIKMILLTAVGTAVGVAFVTPFAQQIARKFGIGTA